LVQKYIRPVASKNEKSKLFNTVDNDTDSTVTW
jgi:hypothetical protein